MINLTATQTVVLIFIIILEGQPTLQYCWLGLQNYESDLGLRLLTCGDSNWGVVQLLFGQMVYRFYFCFLIPNDGRIRCCVLWVSLNRYNWRSTVLQPCGHPETSATTPTPLSCKLASRTCYYYSLLLTPRDQGFWMEWRWCYFAFIWLR